jgi:hypothetical protein
VRFMVRIRSCLCLVATKSCFAALLGFVLRKERRVQMCKERWRVVVSYVRFPHTRESELEVLSKDGEKTTQDPVFL